jgi:ABC-type sulfate transport system substrate-binding protein
LIPENIKASVKQNFPQAKIIKLEREFGGFEVKLNNGIELKL